MTRRADDRRDVDRVSASQPVAKVQPRRTRVAEVSVKSADLRLGQIEAFIALARHSDYKKAASELGRSQKQTRADFEGLEGWLHKLLMLYGPPMEIHDPDGVDFLDSANTAINGMRQLIQAEAGGSGSIVDLRYVTVSELRLLAACRNVPLKRAALDANLSMDGGPRKLRALQGKIGQAVITSGSRPELTDFGVRLAEKSSQVVRLLEASRNHLPNDLRYNVSKAHELHRVFLIERVRYAIALRRLENKPTKSKLVLKRIAYYEGCVELYDECLLTLRNYFKPVYTVDGANVII